MISGDTTNDKERLDVLSDNRSSSGHGKRSSSFSPSLGSEGTSSSMHYSLNGKQHSSTCDKSKKEREERMKLMRERQEKEHERRTSELRAAQEREAQLRRANDLERERRIKELRDREMSRHKLVEERRKLLEQQELERRQQIMSKYQKDKAATAPRTKRPAYAFGSSTPRTLAYLESLNREMKVYDARLQSAQAVSTKHGDENNATMNTSFSTPKKAISTANLVRRPFSAKVANNRMSTSIHVTSTSRGYSASAHPPRRSEHSSPKETGVNLVSARMTQSVIAVHSTPTDSKTALQERRRLAREQAEKERELQKQKREQKRLEEEERARKEEERKRLKEEERQKAEEEERLRREEAEFRRREEEELRAIEEMKLAEEERLRQAIEDERIRREEEERKAEEARKRQLEAEMKLREHNERLEREKRETEERMRREEEERSERRKKLDAIMKRTRNSAPKPLNSSTTELNTSSNGPQNSTGPILENGISHSASHYTNNGPTFPSPPPLVTDFRSQSPNDAITDNGDFRNHVTSSGNHVTPSGMTYSSSSAALLQKYANSKSEIGRSVENILAKVRSSTPTNRHPPPPQAPSTLIGLSTFGSAHRLIDDSAYPASPLAKSVTASGSLDGNDDFNQSNLSTPTTASSNQDDARAVHQSQLRKSVVDQIDEQQQQQYGRNFNSHVTALNSHVTQLEGSKILNTDQITQYDVDANSAASVSQYASIVLNNGDADRRNLSRD